MLRSFFNTIYFRLIAYFNYTSNDNLVPVILIAEW